MEIIIGLLVFFGVAEMVVHILRAVIGAYQGLTGQETMNTMTGEKVKMGPFMIIYQILTIVGLILIIINLFIPLF